MCISANFIPITGGVCPSGIHTQIQPLKPVYTARKGYMMNKSCTMKRILALVLALITLLPCAPALAQSITAILTEAAPVYADAAFSEKISDLDAYTLVTVKAVKGNVAQIKYKGYTVYTGTDALASVDEMAIPGLFTENSYVFEEPDLDSRNVGVKKNTLVNVLYINGDWAMVEKNGKLGYAYADHLAPAANGDDEEESGKDPFLPEVEDSVEQPKDDNSDESVTVETIAAKVAAATLPVYKSASTDSKKLGTLKYGKEVTVYAYNSAWAYIGLNGKYGFCALSGLEKVSAEAPEEEPETPVVDLSKAIPATVTAKSVKVYKSASTSADTLGTLKKGAEVNVVKTSGDWAFIELNGKLGYCALAALTKTSDLEKEEPEEESKDETIADKTPLGTATVIEPSAPLYNSMSASTPSSTLAMGDTYNYYGYDSKWVLVGKDGVFGFVPRKYLNADTYAELEKDDTGDGVKELEQALLALGYLDSMPGKTYTAYTAEAVSRLQAACGMNQTGAADIAVLRVLYSGKAPVSPMLGVALSKGDNNSNVKRLQTRLLALGYLSRSSSADGDYGSTTASAIKLFQTACGVSATGTADNATIKALYNAAAPTLPSGSTAADAVSVSAGNSGSSSNSTDMSSGLTSTTDKLVAGMSNAQKLEYVIYVAQQQLGKRYVFGASGTATFDCSGLTMYCFKQIGVSLAHSAYSEGYNNNRTKISSASSLRRGDLVFFNTMSDGDQCDHVGIYLGSGQFIHASSGAGKVVVSSLDSGYYSRVFSWGRRVLDA